MQQHTVIDNVQWLNQWFTSHQPLLIHYIINLIAAILIFVSGRLGACILSNGVEKILKHKAVDYTIVLFVKLLVRYAILFVVVVAALGAIGVQTGSIVAVIGTAGLAVAFAIKDSLANFAAGILLVIFRPFRIDEQVEFAGVTGIVESIQFFSTILKTNDYKMVVVPNGAIIRGNIINYSRQPRRRIELIVGVAYSTDIEQVKTILLNLVTADARVLKNPEATVRLRELAPSSLNFIVRVWVENANYWPVYFDLLENIKKQLDKHKIGIPFPQMEVHLHQEKGL